MPFIAGLNFHGFAILVQSTGTKFSGHFYSSIPTLKMKNELQLFGFSIVVNWIAQGVIFIVFILRHSLRTTYIIHGIQSGGDHKYNINITCERKWVTFNSVGSSEIIFWKILVLKTNLETTRTFVLIYLEMTTWLVISMCYM